jgi:alkylation response protein AidB-like acyl-CoA dehydrogenase
MSGQIELQPTTRAGARLASIADMVAPSLACRAAEHDRNGTYPFDTIEELKASGYFTAPIPEVYGGLGVDSVHDILVAGIRVSRVDAATMLGVNMHLLIVFNMVRRWRMARSWGDERRVSAFGRSLESIVNNGSVIAAAVSEPRQNLTRPSTRATRTEAGWTLSGKKIFCSMAPAATQFAVSVSFCDAQENPRYGYAEVPARAPGVRILDDWDALGMRASGSHSVVFDEVQLPASALRGGFPAGTAAGLMSRNLASGLFHASGAVGIAEATHSAVLDRLGKTMTGAPWPSVQGLAAENAIGISALRAVISRAAHLVDDYHRAHPASDGPERELATVFAEVQAAKAFVSQAAARVVNRALTLSGGAGYLNRDPLSRAYRDVRASDFMQPLSTSRAYDFIGQLALGLEPSLN